MRDGCSGRQAAQLARDLLTQAAANQLLVTRLSRTCMQDSVSCTCAPRPGHRSHAGMLRLPLAPVCARRPASATKTTLCTSQCVQPRVLPQVQLAAAAGAAASRALHSMPHATHNRAVTRPSRASAAIARTRMPPLQQAVLPHLMPACSPGSIAAAASQAAHGVLSKSAGRGCKTQLLLAQLLAPTANVLFGCLFSWWSLSCCSLLCTHPGAEHENAALAHAPTAGQLLPQLAAAPGSPCTQTA